MVIINTNLIQIVQDRYVSDEEGNRRMEENRNRNVVPTQVYSVQEEVSKGAIPYFITIGIQVIGPIDDCNELDHIFSIVFGDLFDE